ncbi:MAG: ATP-dependent DNA helicase RecG [Tissierellia bacterium]|nr:ATP-dependent DNA helicase RecG [Tissierellia bacterium]
MDQYSKIREVPGVGEKLERVLLGVGIYTIEDLLFALPISYEDRTKTTTVRDLDDRDRYLMEVTIVGKSRVIYRSRGMHMQRFQVADETGQTEMTLFNQSYMDRQLPVGKRIFVFAKGKRFGGRYVLSSPKIVPDKPKEMGLVPHYRSLGALKGKRLSGIIHRALEGAEIHEFIPPYLLRRYGLMGRKEAFWGIHQPQDRDELERARQRLIFEEYLLFQLYVAANRAVRGRGIALADGSLVEELRQKLPFSLTEAQEEAFGEIARDLASGDKMARLLQGDVGSGKTVVAQLAAAQTAGSGHQTMVMAPTEILARQHLESFRGALEPLGLRVELLLGSTRAQQRRKVLEAAQLGQCDVLIGTHALVQDPVKMARLGLVITDEQHRFGVEQRQRLEEKGEGVNVLVMSATPIPRSLSAVLYADLDISIMRGMPHGRKAVETMTTTSQQLDRVHDFMRSILEKKEQCYVVCPLIEEASPTTHSAQEVYQNYLEIFGEDEVGILHGQMSPQEKGEVMGAFQRGEIFILVATTIIEVGVNVPNASLLLVYDADRFGLSTLHQLRGRVGRGDQQAYCILHSDSDNAQSWQRLKVLESSTDGFVIAEEDMKSRGIGNYFGTEQSGISNFRTGNPLEHMDIMAYAKKEAEALVASGHFNREDEEALFHAYGRYLYNQNRHPLSRNIHCDKIKI